MISPYRVLSTALNRSHERASASVDPDAAAPWSRMSSSATSAGAGCAARSYAAATQAPLGGGERYRERPRASNDEQEEGEIEESPFGEDDADGLRRARKRVDGDARARPPLDDVEHERPGDRIRVR